MDPSVIIKGSKFSYMKQINGLYCDYEPDLFMFNFNGHTGEFMINNEGKAQTDKNGYSVDINELSIQHPYGILFPDQVSTITIKTPDGFIYTFGGALEALEFSIRFKEQDQWDAVNNPTVPIIMAWHLKEITAPSGRKVYFNYANPALTNYWQSTTSPIWEPGPVKPASNPEIRNGSAVKKVILESIEIEGTDVKIEFENSIEKTLNNYNNRFFSNHHNFNAPGYQLDAILVKDGNMAKKYELKYRNIDRRRFLEAIIMPDKGEYGFTYDHGNYPSPGETYMDVYGYYSQNNLYNSLSLLNRINYPTGGYTLLSYEKHYYASKVEFNIYSLHKYQVSATPDGKFGGARIRKIENYSSSGKKETQQEYIYRYGLSSTFSSGILHLTPPRLDNGVVIGADFWRKNYNINETTIGYSKVIEKNIDNSYTINTFTDYATNSDKLIYIATFDRTVENALLLTYTGMGRVASNSKARGLLEEKAIYDANGKKVFHERYKYKGVNADFEIPENIEEENYPDNYIISFKSVYGGGYPRKIYLKSHPLIYKNTEIDQVTKEEKMTYNELDQLKSIETIIGHLDTHKTIYTYPGDLQYISGGNTIDYQKEMVSKHILSPVLETQVYRNNKLLKRQVNTYKTIYLERPIPVLSEMKEAFGDANNLQTKETYHSYNEFARPVYITKNNTDHTVLVWGFGGRYLGAKILNTTPQEIKNTIGKSPESLFADSDWTLINTLRTHSAMVNSHITTYKYKPLVGVTEITDPSGATIYYEYDSFGRLIRTKDLNGNTIEEYKYHYRNQ